MYTRGFAGLAGDQPPYFAFAKTSGPTPYPAFQVGDAWTITIAGPANAPIFVASVQNGVPKPAAQFGTTDANGNFSFQGTMLPEAVGSWTETWFIGRGGGGPGDPTRNLLSAVNFTVAAPVQKSADATNTSTPTTAPPLPPSGSGCTDGPGIVCIGSYAIPTWALFGAAGLAAFMLLGGRHR